MENKVMVILGMHRSGTSLVTQWLYKCGLQVGEELLAASVGNMEGHFEDLDFFKFHVSFLLKNNLPKSGFVSSPLPDVGEKDREILKDIIAQKNAHHKEWGWKDPRSCLFLDLYKEFIPQANYLIIYRDFRSTVSSMITRDFKIKKAKYAKKNWFGRLYWKVWRSNKESKMVLEKNAMNYLQVWIFYNQQLLAFIETLDKKKYKVVNYQLLLKNDVLVFTQIKENWKFALHYFPFTDVYNPNLLSTQKDITHYVTTSLLAQAQAIERAFSLFKN